MGALEGTSMKDLLLYIAQNLVENPDAVSVTEIERDGELTLELRVAPEDMGKVIGRQGRIAKEIRTEALLPVLWKVSPFFQGKRRSP